MSKPETTDIVLFLDGQDFPSCSPSGRKSEVWAYTESTGSAIANIAASASIENIAIFESMYILEYFSI